MYVIVEFVILLTKLAYVCVEALVLAFLPASIRGKDIAGETVLITGAGRVFIPFYFNVGDMTIID